MTREEKQLLLIDLCARLPYGVMCDRLGQPKKLLSVTPHKVYPLEFDHGEYMPNDYKVEDVKPYLRPMSSMTEEELSEYRGTCRYWNIHGTVIYENTAGSFVWLNAHHFDYRGLIPMGLALEAPKDMYKTE